jgi:hypothetical protein
MDLTPLSKLQGQTQAPLPDVTVVFAAVEMGDTFISRHSHAEVHALHKAIVLCMGLQLGMLPAEDGYLCRCAVVKCNMSLGDCNMMVLWLGALSPAASSQV